MNPHKLNDTKVDEDAKGFIKEVFKVDCMVVATREKRKLATYKLKDVSKVWFEQWRDERSLRAGSVDWGVFDNSL